MDPMTSPRTRIVAPAAAASALALALLGSTPALAAGSVPVDAAASPHPVINEIESDAPHQGADWIELANPSGQELDLTGYVLSDSDPSAPEDTSTFPEGSTLAPHGDLQVEAGTDDPALGLPAGLGKDDAAQLFAPGSDPATDEPVDAYAWGPHAEVTYGRFPDVTGDFVDTAEATPGAPNVGPAEAPVEQPPADETPQAPEQPAAIPGLVVNEVESNNDDTDWAEFGNASDVAIDLSGYLFTDSEPAADKQYVLPPGSITEPGGYLVVDQAEQAKPGFDFGLGNDDAVRLYAPGTDVEADGAAPVLEYSWGPHASVTYGRCPDLTGPLVDTTRSTKGAANDCSSPLVINEVTSVGDDFVELFNTGATAVDPNGLILTDSEPAKHALTLEGYEPVQSGGYLLIDADALGFGLGGEDAAQLFAAGTDVTSSAAEPLDAVSWDEPTNPSLGRSPDGTGDFTATASATPGEANDVGDGSVRATAWPGGPEQTVIPVQGDEAGDWSGIDFEASASGGPGVLWVVQNGDGELYRLDSTDGGKTWQRTRSFELRYADGSGTLDSEGVSVSLDGSAGGIYVSTERDNDHGDISRPAIVRFQLPADAVGSEPIAAQDGKAILKADADWNLAADFPGLGANSGLEGVSIVPDAWLTGHSILDENTGAAYDPATYPGHGAGLIATGVEGTGHVYLYALMEDGSFQRVADVETGFPIVADVQFDAERGQLWAVCDEICNGRIAVLTPQASDAVEGTSVLAVSALYERPADSENVANEGFAFADLSQCVDGAVPTYYVDDNGTDGHSLRTGTLSTECPVPTQPSEPTVPGEPSAPSEPATPEEHDAAPAAPAAPAEETPETQAPAEEAPAVPAHHEAPSREEAPAQEAAPVQEDAPTQEDAPAQEDTTKADAPAQEQELAHTGFSSTLGVVGLGIAALGVVTLLATRRRKA